MWSRALAVLLFCCGLFVLAQAQYAPNVQSVILDSQFKKVAAGGGPVALDACGTAATTVINTTAITNSNITVTTGNALVVQLILENRSAPGLSVKWDNAGTPQSMTQIVTVTAVGGTVGGFVSLWGLINPTPGNKQLAATWTTVNSSATIDGCAWSGVNSTFGTAFPNTNTATGSTNAISVTVTSATNHAVMSAGGETLGNGWTSGNTPVFTNVNASCCTSGGSRAAGAASVNMTASTISSNWAIAATDISF
jgi:hypothetical protein